jgi:hypothetical protein
VNFLTVFPFCIFAIVAAPKNFAHRNTMSPVKNFLCALAVLLNKETCSPGELMKIISLFLCANLASEGKEKYVVARYSAEDGLSIDFLRLKELYPGSFIKLGKEKNGKSSLAAGYFTIFVSYECHEYKLLYKGTKEDGKFIKSFSIFENEDEVFYAELVFRDGKSFFEIWENMQDSYFASLSRSKNASHSRAGPASAGPSSAASASTGPALARPALAGPARIPSLPKVGNWNPYDDDDDDDSNENWADIGAPKTSVQVAPAPKTPVQVAPVPKTPVQDAPAPMTPVQVAPAQETSVQGALAPKTERLELIKRLVIPGLLRMSLMKSSISEDDIKLALELLEENEMEDYFKDLLSQKGSSSA